MRGLLLLVLVLTACLVAGVAHAGEPREVTAKRAELLARAEALGVNQEGLTDSKRLAEFIDLYFEYTMNEHPEFGTMIGHPTGHDRWTDSSLAANERRNAEGRRALEIFQTLNRDSLTGEDRLNFDLIMENMIDGVERQRFLGEYLDINQMGGVQQNPARMMAMMPARSLQQYDDILGRLAGVPQLIANSLEKLQLGIEKGVMPPKVTLRDVPQQIQNQLVEDPMQSPMLRAFANFPASVSAADQERLKAEASRIYSEEIVPAYRRLHDFLVETYIPAARASIAMRDLPDGEDWYAFNVKQMTTTDLTPEEIHQIGLSEVARIRAEMDRVIEESGFEGSFAEFTEFLRTDPQFYFEDEEELLKAYRDICKRADGELVKLFGHLPRLPYAVVPVPEYAEQSQTTAYYQPGSLEAGRPGQFFANTYDLPSRPSWEMEALSLHEAVPGHHLQIAIQNELENMPWFRRFGGETAFTEGWGLYSESLGADMGFYRDPYSRFGQLTYEIWRAIRLVVDTGMHHLGWSREQAIEYFKQNTGKAEHDIVVEVDRYIVWPGQALAYKIGELKIKELRALAEQELGDGFDIRSFHDRVLGNGALPLRVLETHVREWIAQQKGEVPEVAPPTVKG